MFCPGPRAPEYTCVGGRGGPCPLAEAADVVVLDLDLDSEAVEQGTASSELLSYYTGLGKPVVAFGPYAQVVRAYAEGRVRAIRWPVRREELIGAVADAFVRSRVVATAQEGPVGASNAGAEGVPIDLGPQRGAMEVAREWVERIEDGDVDGALALYAPKARLHVGRERFEGRDAIRGYLQGIPLLRRHPGNMEISPEDHSVLVRWEGSAGGPGGHTRLISAAGKIADQWLVLRAGEGEAAEAGGASQSAGPTPRLVGTDQVCRHHGFRGFEERAVRNLVDEDFIDRRSTTVTLRDSTRILIRPVVPGDKRRFRSSKREGSDWA